jgi:hypothetical protein
MWSWRSQKKRAENLLIEEVSRQSHYHSKKSTQFPESIDQLSWSIFNTKIKPRRFKFTPTDCPNWEQINLSFRPKSKRGIKVKQKTEKKRPDQTSIVWLNSGKIVLDLISSRQLLNLFQDEQKKKKKKHISINPKAH